MHDPKIMPDLYFEWICVSFKCDFENYVTILRGLENYVKVVNTALTSYYICSLHFNVCLSQINHHLSNYKKLQKKPLCSIEQSTPLQILIFIKDVL